MAAAYTLSAAIALTQNQHERAVSLCERAVELAPSDYFALGFLGMINVYTGNSTHAATLLNSAMRFSPKRDSWLVYYIALANFWMSNFQAALEHATLHSIMEPGDGHGYAYLAAIYEFQGRCDEASNTIAQLRAKVPAFGVKNIKLSERYKESWRLDRLLEALNRAGLPD